MKKFTNKQIEEKLNDFVNFDDREYIKRKCFETIFKTQMSVKKYAEFLKKVFEIEVSTAEISKWKKEFDEVKNGDNTQSSGN